jgi:hypothetical protein
MAHARKLLGFANVVLGNNQQLPILIFKWYLGLNWKPALTRQAFYPSDLFFLFFRQSPDHFVQASLKGWFFSLHLLQSWGFSHHTLLVSNLLPRLASNIILPWSIHWVAGIKMWGTTPDISYTHGTKQNPHLTSIYKVNVEEHWFSHHQ